MKRSLWRVGCVMAIALIGLAATTLSSGNSKQTGTPGCPVRGIVTAESGPLARSVVRVQGTSVHALTDASGRFELSDVPTDRRVNISAWKQGYYCAIQRDVSAPLDDVRLHLIRYQRGDNPGYVWIPPTGKGGCSDCHHPAIIEMSLIDAHLNSAQNPRFLTMYYGRDMDGNQGPVTRYGEGHAIWKNIRMPLPPDPSQPYYGPGYILDFPENPIQCTACHVPGASVYKDADPETVSGADRYGVHCDYCHKVADVRIDPVTRLPFPDFPGVRSMELRRPFPNDPERHQLFFGTFDDDNVPEEDTRLPLLEESRYCAACHYGVFWSTLIYNSYGEWLESPYSDPASGTAKTCQECHMASPTVWKGDTVTNAAPGKGGIERDPSAIHSHLMTVADDLLQNALTLTAEATEAGETIIVKVTLTNDRTGHHIPTDCPLRHLILLVDARDAEGTRLKQSTGPVTPGWCGMGKPEDGCYAGLPGKTYAKLLMEKWTNRFPAAAYWRHTDLVGDNRLAAFESDTTAFSFARPANGTVQIQVRLLYRRAYKELIDQKKWDAPDVVMAEERFVLSDRSPRPLDN